VFLSPSPKRVEFCAVQTYLMRDERGRSEVDRISGYPVQASDGWTLRTKDGSLSAHHEHTLLITRGAPIVLTAPAA
jgi:methionine aminopeptidase